MLLFFSGLRCIQQWPGCGVASVVLGGGFGFGCSVEVKEGVAIDFVTGRASYAY